MSDPHRPVDPEVLKEFEEASKVPASRREGFVDKRNVYHGDVARDGEEHLDNIVLDVPENPED
jgi:hypothetical protein